jgi:acetolactate synthase I/II/III large subunit
MTTGKTRAEAIIATFARRGMKRMFGVPGGGSSLALIDAARQYGVEFVLCRGETSAALMAAVSGEITGNSHIILTGIAPGAASATNGVAYASLEHAPLTIITDARDADGSNNIHQSMDQQGLFRPITKSSLVVDEKTSLADIEDLVDISLTAPTGPVHMDLSTRVAGSPVSAPDPVPHPPAHPVPDCRPLARALSTARKPVLVVGLEARSDKITTSLLNLAEALQCPVLTTYKAKGVFDEDHVLFVGHFTGAQAEAETLNQADLIIGFGLDPVEIIPGPWSYTADLVMINTSANHNPPAPATSEITGRLDEIADTLVAHLSSVNSQWELPTISGLHENMAARLALPPGNGFTTDTVVSLTQSAFPNSSRACVDAGAHMFSVMALWKAHRPHDVLKSNGLSTMGFALPAGIAASLVDPARPVVAFTGDGGLMMCLAELSTAVGLGCNLTIIVLNDGALSLIDIKQQRLQQPSSGVRYPLVDFKSCAEGLGCPAWRADDRETFSTALDSALATKGPALIDARIDASGYASQLEALRG